MDTAASLTQAGVVLGNLGGVVFRSKCLSCERMEGYGTGRGLSLSPAVALFSKVLRAESRLVFRVGLVWGRPGVCSRRGDGASSSACA